MALGPLIAFDRATVCSEITASTPRETPHGTGRAGPPCKPSAPSTGASRGDGASTNDPGYTSGKALVVTKLYRSGKPKPSNIRSRPGEDGVSFRDTLSNPWPLGPGQKPIFPLGGRFFAVDPSRLPDGSVIQTPPEGHWIIKGVPPDLIKQAVTERGAFPP